MKLFRFHGEGEGEESSLSNVHSTGLCHFALNYPAEPQKFDQRTQFIRSEAECSDPVSRFSTSPDFFLSFFLSLSIRLIPLPFLLFHGLLPLPVFYLPVQFIPVYRHFVSSPTQEARKTILKSGIRCLTGGVWGDCNIGGIWLWDNRDSFSLSFFFLFLLLSFDFTTFAFILFGSFLPWGTLGFDTGLINFSLSFYFFDVPRILSFIRLLCFGG